MKIGQHFFAIQLLVMGLQNKRRKVASLIIGPAIGLLKQSTQVIDLASVIEIMGDHNADDIAGRESLSPIREPLPVQLAVILQRADGGEPAPVTFR